MPDDGRMDLVIRDRSLKTELTRIHRKRRDKCKSKTAADLMRAGIVIDRLFGDRKIELIGGQVVLGTVVDTTA
jgi:hypothetical protein